MKIIFLDTETTGFGQCRMVELAYTERGSQLMYAARVKPPIPMTQNAIDTHGITEEMIEGLEPFVNRPEYSKVKEELENAICVAHNAQFDRDVLAREGINPKIWICTKRVAQQMYKFRKTHRLQELREVFNIISPGTAHSAAGDVMVLELLFEIEMKDLIRLGDNEEQALAKMVQWS